MVWIVGLCARPHVSPAGAGLLRRDHSPSVERSAPVVCDPDSGCGCFSRRREVEPVHRNRGLALSLQKDVVRDSCTPGTVSILARKHTPAQVFLRFDLVGDRHAVRLSRLFELGQGFVYESVRQPMGIRIARSAVGTVHVDQTQRAAVRTAQEQDRSSGSARRIDGDFAIRRGVYLETPGRGSVHGVQQPARVSQRLSGRRRKPLFACFVPRLVQIGQGIAQVRMNDRRFHEGYIRPISACRPCILFHDVIFQRGEARAFNLLDSLARCTEKCTLTTRLRQGSRLQALNARETLNDAPRSSGFRGHDGAGPLR